MPLTKTHDLSTEKSVISDPNICHQLNGINTLSHTHTHPQCGAGWQPAADCQSACPWIRTTFGAFSSPTESLYCQSEGDANAHPPPNPTQAFPNQHRIRSTAPLRCPPAPHGRPNPYESIGV